MADAKKNRSIIRSIKDLFGIKKATTYVNPHELYPEAYYKRYFLCESNANGVDWLAKTRRKSKVSTINELVALGFHAYLSREFREYNQAVADAKDGLPRPVPPHIIKQFVKYAKKQGYDIKKFF
jgi:hypothetical protein